MAYQNNYNNNNQGRNQGQKKKHSGAKEGIQRAGVNEGKIYISAWVYRKNHGLIKISGFENRKSTRSQSERGNQFVTIMFECFYKDSGNTILELANYNLTTGKVFLEKLGYVVSTKAPNGGYTGPINTGGR
jgi:hypothetical protein